MPTVVDELPAEEELEELDRIEENTQMEDQFCGGCGESPAPPRKRDPPTSSPATLKPKRSKTRREVNDKKTDEDVFMEQCDRLEEMGTWENCRKKSRGESHCSCTCLHFLRNPIYRNAVASYLVHQVDRKSQQEVNQQVVHWHNYAKMVPLNENSKGHKGYAYRVPFDGTEAIAVGDDLTELQDGKICQNAMLQIMGIGLRRFGGIKKAAETTGVAPNHKLKGVSQAIAEDDPRMIALREHFEELCQLGETRATRLVANLVDGTNESRDDDDKNVYLPSSKGYRPCYYRYLHDLGYKATPHANGNLTIKWDGPSNVETRPPYVCLSTYFSKWKRYYPHLKVSVPSEDICNLCFQFANRHRYMAKHKRDDCNVVLNSLQDGDLFRDDAFQNLGDKDLQLSDSDDEQREPASSDAVIATAAANSGPPSNPGTAAVATTTTNTGPPSNPSTTPTNATAATGDEPIPVAVDAPICTTAGLTAGGSARQWHSESAVRRSISVVGGGGDAWTVCAGNPMDDLREKC